MKKVIDDKNETVVSISKCDPNKLYLFTDDLTLYILKYMASSLGGGSWRWINLNSSLILHDVTEFFSNPIDAIRAIEYPVYEFENIGEVLSSDVFNILY